MNRLFSTPFRFLLLSLGTASLLTACARTKEAENPAYTATESARRAMRQESAGPAQDTTGAAATAPDAELSAVATTSVTVPTTPQPTTADYQTAIRTANAGLKKNPRNLTLLLTRAEAERQLGNYQQALPDYTAALHLTKDDPTIYYQRGLVNLQLKGYNSAISDFSKALKYKADYKEALYNRGKAKMQMTNYKSAIADFDQAIALDSAYAEAYENRGISYSSISKPTEAHADLEKAAQLQRQVVQ